MPKQDWHTTESSLWRKLKPEVRRMRQKPTEAEERLWQQLRKRELGVRFRRQHAIDRFIVDYCSLKAKVIVEVDGEIHRLNRGQDQERDELLAHLGYRILRFTNEAVMTDMENV